MLMFREYPEGPSTMTENTNTHCSKYAATALRVLLELTHLILTTLRGPCYSFPFHIWGNWSTERWSNLLKQRRRTGKWQSWRAAGMRTQSAWTRVHTPYSGLPPRQAGQEPSPGGDHCSLSGHRLYKRHQLCTLDSLSRMTGSAISESPI